MPINQKGNFLPILGLVVLLIVVGVVAYYLKTDNATTQPEIINTPQDSYIKNSDTTCKPALREFEGQCTLGQIIVQTKRTLTKEDLQLLLDKYTLTVLTDWSIEGVKLDIRKLDKEFTSPQWQEKLKDTIVLNVTISDIAYTDGTYSDGTVSFSKDVTDQQIDDYIQKKGIEKAVYHKWGTDNAYTIKVPDGTESDWREKLMNDSKDITDVRLTYNSFPVPL